MNVLPFPKPPPDLAPEAFVAPLMTYAEAFAVGPIPYLNVNQGREQALCGLKHTMALAPNQGANFLSIHRRVWSEQKQKFVFPGTAHASFDTAVDDAFYWAKKKLDVYWSMGAQAKPGEHYDGKPYPSAIRQEWNVVLLRCLYIDIDVKPPNHPDVLAGKAYATTHEAVETLIGFVRALGWEPSMIVGSGSGGLHVYWRLKQAVGVKKFRLFGETLKDQATAHKLRIDIAVSADPTRLLRVPGTWNFKGGPGTPGRAVTIIFGGN